MEPEKNSSEFSKFRKAAIFLSIILLLAGVNVAILISKWSRIFGLLLAAAGGVMLYYSIGIGKKKEEGKMGTGLGSSLSHLRKKERAPIISERAVYYLTFKGRFPWMMELTGILMAGWVIFYNIYFNVNSYLGSNDYLVLLLAASFISYNHIPRDYKIEREFVLIFFSILFLIIVIPTTYYSLKYGTTEGSWDDENPDSPMINFLLVKPLIFILEVLDINAAGDGVRITFLDSGSKRMSVSIALGCTGLYSVSIFLSAFTSYILVEYRKFNRKVILFLVVGVITSYFANLLRMLIIIFVGYYRGMDALLWTHENIGEVIFMFWIAIFWGLMYKYMDIELPWAQESEKEGKYAPKSDKQDKQNNQNKKHTENESTEN